MHTMHLLPSVAIQPNLELKTRAKQLLGSLPLVITLPDDALWVISEWRHNFERHPRSVIDNSS